MLLLMKRNYDHKTVLQFVEFDIKRYCFLVGSISLQKSDILSKYIQSFMLEARMFILQNL